MIELMEWTERAFTDRLPAGVFPAVLERLRGTPARVEELAAAIPGELHATRVGEQWSIQEHVGHLGDLEPLWATRLDELLAGARELTAADMTNRATRGARHNDAPMEQLLARFRAERRRLVERLEAIDDDAVEAAALHPRLKQPMRTIDLCRFVAEHDDHHLAVITRMWRALASAPRR